MKQRVLILSKAEDERRRWTDDTDIHLIADQLRSLFDVEVDLLSSLDIREMSLSDQINRVLEYEVMVSPAGGLSFMGHFMREGTAMIEVDYYAEHTHRSAHLDSYIQAYFADKKVYYYYVTGDDWEYNATIESKKPRYPKTKRMQLRNIANYRLRIERLAKYVYSALLWIENYNELEAEMVKKVYPHPVIIKVQCFFVLFFSFSYTFLNTFLIIFCFLMYFCYF